MHSVNDTDMREIFFALCKTIDTPVSLGCWLRYKYTHTELAAMDINPRDYTSAATFGPDYACASYLSKYVALNTGLDLEAVALQKFTTAEDSCRETNRRFRHLAIVKNSRLHHILHVAQRKIAKLLGPFSWFCVDRGYGWGPGATYEIPRRRAQVDIKIGELPYTVSTTARGFLKAVIERDLHWSASILGVYPEGPYSLLRDNFVIQDACRIETVPKNAKTHRIIAVEPRGNGYLQKGFGRYIRDRLRTVGINLDDQGVNQRLAAAAFHAGLATLDLKAASDTVSKEVVFHLLPYDWADSLDAVRSRYAEMPDGSKVVLEKFSSMGNGFTFELESLIFWAISSAVRDLSDPKGVVAVYGDDIIVSSSFAPEVSFALQFCGFSLNDDKSFFDGPFYESCGKQYFQGEEVTPAYQKEVPEPGLSGFRCGNRLMRLAFRLGRRRGLSKLVKPAWDCSRRLFGFPEYQIPFGTEGNDAWLTLYAEFHFQRQKRWDMGIRCRVLHHNTFSFPANERALLAQSMRQSGIFTEWKAEEETRRFLAVTDSLPYGGQVEVMPRKSHPVSRYRRVIPDGQFSALWT